MAPLLLVTMLALASLAPVAAQAPAVMNISQLYTFDVPRADTPLQFVVYPSDKGTLVATIVADPAATADVLLKAYTSDAPTCPTCVILTQAYSEAGVDGSAYFSLGSDPVGSPAYLTILRGSAPASASGTFTVIVQPMGSPPSGGVVQTQGAALGMGSSAMLSLNPGYSYIAEVAVPAGTALQAAFVCYTGKAAASFVRLDGFSSNFYTRVGPVQYQSLEGGTFGVTNLIAFSYPLTYYLRVTAPINGVTPLKCKLSLRGAAFASPSPAPLPPSYVNATRIPFNAAPVALTAPVGGVNSYFYAELPAGPSLYGVKMTLVNGSFYALGSISGFANGTRNPPTVEASAMLSVPGTSDTYLVPPSGGGVTLFYQVTAGSRETVPADLAVSTVQLSGPLGLQLPSIDLAVNGTAPSVATLCVACFAFFQVTVPAGYTAVVTATLPTATAAGSAVRLRLGSAVPTTGRNVYSYVSEVNVTTTGSTTASCSAVGALTPTTCVYQATNLQAVPVDVSFVLGAALPTPTGTPPPPPGASLPSSATPVPSASSSGTPASTSSGSATPSVTPAATTSPVSGVSPSPVASPSPVPSPSPAASASPVTTLTPTPTRTPSPSATSSPAPVLQPFIPYTLNISPQSSVQYAALLAGGIPYTLSVATTTGCVVAQGYYTLSLDTCSLTRNCTVAFSTNVCAGSPSSQALALSQIAFPLFVVLANAAPAGGGAVTAYMTLGAVSPTPTPSVAPTGVPFSRLQPNNESPTATLAAGASSYLSLTQPAYSLWAVYVTASSGAVVAYIGMSGFPSCPSCTFGYSYVINPTRNDGGGSGTSARLLLGVDGPVTYSGNVSVPMQSTPVTLYVRVQNQGSTAASYSIALLPPGSTPTAVPTPPSSPSPLAVAVGVALGVTALILLFAYLVRRNRKHNRRGRLLSNTKQASSNAITTTVVTGAGGAAYPASFVDFGAKPAMELPGVVVPNPAVGVVYGRSGV